MLSRTVLGPGGGSTYWQAGGGTQLRVPRHDLWFRGEWTAARNMDLTTRNLVPRESMSFGVNGQLSRRTNLALNVNMDRSPSPSVDRSSWITRSMLRVTRTMPTGAVYMANGVLVRSSSVDRGTGTIGGSVFADWNANGVPDAGENSLEGIPLRLGGGVATTGRDGQFAFLNVPAGVREIGLDTGGLPIDFDPPAVTALSIEITRGDLKRVAFGLIPLGSIHGRVIRDLNGNGKADPNEEPIDGAILILDGGARSEQARRGRYRFDAVRSGTHVVKLLVDSLPEGAQIAGDAEASVALTREMLSADVSFVVAVEKRPEIRKVFPPRGAGAAAAAPRAAPRAVPTRPAAPVRTIPETRSAGSRSGPATVAPPVVTPQTDATASGLVSPNFAVQIAALSDPLRARDMVGALQAAGMPAYLVGPAAADPDGPYRIRVGPYATRAAAQETASTLQKKRGEKMWVTKEP